MRRRAALLCAIGCMYAAVGGASALPQCAGNNATTAPCACDGEPTIVKCAGLSGLRREMCDGGTVPVWTPQYCSLYTNFVRHIDSKCQLNAVGWVRQLASYLTCVENELQGRNENGTKWYKEVLCDSKNATDGFLCIRAMRHVHRCTDEDPLCTISRAVDSMLELIYLNLCVLLAMLVVAWLLDQLLRLRTLIRKRSRRAHATSPFQQQFAAWLLANNVDSVMETAATIASTLSFFIFVLLSYTRGSAETEAQFPVRALGLQLCSRPRLTTSPPD